MIQRSEEDEQMLARRPRGAAFPNFREREIEVKGYQKEQVERC